MKIFNEMSVRSIVENIKPNKIVAVGVETDDVDQILNYCTENQCKLVFVNLSSHISMKMMNIDTKKYLTIISDINLEKLDDLNDAQIIFINWECIENRTFSELTILEKKVAKDFPIIFIYNYNDTTIVPNQGSINEKIIKNNESLPLKTEEFLKKINKLKLIEIPIIHGLSIVCSTKLFDTKPEIKEVIDKVILLNELKELDESQNTDLNTNPSLKSETQRIEIQNNNKLLSIAGNRIPVFISQMPYLYILLKSNINVKSLWNNIKGYKAIKRLNLFDEEYYLNEYGVVSNSGMDLLLHYLYFGYKEGKNPNPYFDGKRYLSQYPDVKKAELNPLLHYALWGNNENKKSELVISVILISNNNEENITECLNSILNQTGNFELEIIIGDVSNDKSREIIKEYQKNYGNNIQLVLHEDKLSKYQNIKECFKFVTGEYLAICEGSDRWVDQYKLDKMSKFLDQNQDFSMVFHPTRVINDGIEDQYPDKNFHACRHSAIEIADENFIGNISSCFYRTNIIRTIPSVIFDGIMDEWIFNLICSEQGNIGYINDSLTLSLKKEKLDLKTAFNLKHGLSDLTENNISKTTSSEITPIYRTNSEIKDPYVDNSIFEILKRIFINNPLKKTLKGKNETLFLINDSSCEIRQHFDLFYKSIFNMKVFKKYYNRKLKFCNKRKIQYHFFIVPDKSLVCKDQLPFEVGLVKRNYDSVKGLFPDFIDYLDESSYFKNDSHINYYGAKTLVYHYIKTMDKNFTEKDFDRLINEQIKTIDLVKNGDLLTELNWSYSNEEKEEYMHDRTIIYKNNNLKDLRDNLPEEFKFNGKRDTKYWENKNLDSGLKLMVLRDSSMNILYDLISVKYKEIMLCWDHWQFNQELVEWYNPDVIIEIRTERFLEHMEKFI
jgi:glycosyltransferase involved in cell wall biosynthesis